jgi:hypothetical protein
VGRKTGGGKQRVMGVNTIKVQCVCVCVCVCVCENSTMEPTNTLKEVKSNRGGESRQSMYTFGETPLYN